ncbi:MAG: transglycosylase domain-containing protein [Bdellovibrionota bacterium]
MRRSGIIISTCLGGLLAISAAVIFFVWSIDQEWSGVLKDRILEENNRSSVRVMVRDTVSGEKKWMGSISAGRLEDREPVKLAQVPPLLLQSIVTLEDPRFLGHGGFDSTGILRAMVTNLKTLRYAQGGSTITQQLVKNVLLSNEKTLRRKLTELVLSALVEKKFSKDEILESYLNEIYYGQLGPVEVHGVARAADYYFGKPLQQLELHEMALLAALVKGPGFYSPWKHAERALTRRNFVLGKLFESKMILETEYQEAIKKPLPVRHNLITTFRAPYVMDALRQKLLEERGEAALLSQAFEVTLSLDLGLQEQAEKILLETSQSWEPEQQAILLAADPKTCRILGYVGGTHYQITQLDHIRQIERPIGSLIKPLLLGSLLNDSKVSLATLVDDQPLEWNFDGTHGKWSPSNFDRKFRGKVHVRDILEKSLNVPFVRIFFDINPSGLLWDQFDPVRALGLKLPQERALPASLLGTVEQSPWRTMEAYLRFTRRALGLATTAADLDCKLNFEEVVAPAVAPSSPVDNIPYGQAGSRLALAALEGALRRGTSAALGSKIPLTQTWAGKTGTSSDQRDSWYALMSPDIVFLGWVGRDDNKVTRFTGATGALPLVSAWVRSRLQDPLLGESKWSWPEVPGVGWKLIDPDTGCERSSAGLNKPVSTTPPPEVFDIEGHRAVWELFKGDTVLEACK